MLPTAEKQNTFAVPIENSFGQMRQINLINESRVIMHCLYKLTGFLSFLALLLVPVSAMATIDVAGISFEDNAFADKILTTNYTGEVDGCPGAGDGSLSGAVLGANINTWNDYGQHDFLPGPDGDYNSQAPPSQFIEFTFVDNVIVNGPGNDLVLFEIGSANAALIALDRYSIQNQHAPDSTTLIVTTSSTGNDNSCGVRVNAGYVDLSDLGVEEGASVYRIFVSSPLGIYNEVCWSVTGYEDLGVPEIAAVGALHTAVKANYPPIVHAGDNRVISLPSDTLSLHAEVLDDGLPSDGAITVTWSLESGPAAVTFEDAHAVETAVTFSSSGVYTLAVSADDGEFSRTDSVTVDVTEPDSEVPSIPMAPTVTNVSDTECLLSWAPSSDNVAVSYYEIFRDNSQVGMSDVAQFKDGPLYPLTTYGYSVRAVDISGNKSALSEVSNVTTKGYLLTALVNARDDDAEEGSDGNVQLYSSDLELIHDNAPGDQVVGIRFGEVDLPHNAQILNAYLEFTADSVEEAPASLSISIEDADNAPSFTADQFNISSRQRLGASVAWNDVEAWTGEHIHYQSPDVSALLQTLVARAGWNSGNAVVFIITGTGTRNAKSFEGGALAAPVLHVEYNADNQAPVVDAGENITVSLPLASVTLDAEVSDDGLPYDTITVSWSQLNGPGTAVFSDKSALDSMVSFDVAGTYTLQLEACDGEYTSADTLTVTVTAENQAPIVEAGEDVTVALPLATVTLAGEVSDDGLPNNNISVSWSRLSGPGTAFFTDTSAVDTVVSFDTAGIYILQIEASDGEYSVTDTLVVTVTPENRAPVVNAGGDVTVSLPLASVTLAGEVSDDGLPNNNISMSWSQLSGPGTALFADTSAVDTAVSFDVAGTYTLQLEAYDGEYTTTDTLTVIVTEPDTIPPSVPTGLHGKAISGSEISLYWYLASDNVAVAGYTVYRDDVAIATTANTSYRDRDVSSLTSYTYTVEAFDTSGNVSGRSTAVVVTTLEPSRVLNIQIASGNDDVEEGENGTMDLTSSDLELVDENGLGNQTVGLRFTNVSIPRGVQITRAYIDFETDETGSTATSLRITAEDADNASAFTAAAYNVSSRKKVADIVSWNNVEAWDVLDVHHRTPDLRQVVQNVISRNGWVSGNAMVFIITGTGTRTAESFNGERAAAPILHIEYNMNPYTDDEPHSSAIISTIQLLLKSKPLL